jgi:hypothetical protein
MYKVTLSGSKDGQKFCFSNYDDAFQFASMAVESGTFQDYHYEGNVKTWDDPVPVAVTIVGVEE